MCGKRSEYKVDYDEQTAYVVIIEYHFICYLIIS